MKVHPLINPVVKAICTSSVILVVAIAFIPAASAQSRSSVLKAAARDIRKGMYEDAEKSYRSLLSLDEQDRDARLGLSYALLKMHRLQQAYEEARLVANADRSNARSRALMGAALLASGQFREAKANLYHAAELDPREALAAGGIAEIELFENKSRDAYLLYRRAIALDPNEPDFYRPLARACTRLEHYAEAADALEQFLRVAPLTDSKQRDRIVAVMKFYRRLEGRKLNLPSGAEVAKIKFDLVNNRPYFDVMINGRGPLRFVLDTGASFSLISDDAARKLGISPFSRGGEGRAVGGTGAFPLVYGVLDSVSMGGARIDNVPVYIRTIHQAPEARPEEHYDGYFGLSLLSHYLVTIDYKNGSLTLDRSESPDQLQIAGLDQPVDPIALRSTRDGLASTETRLAATDQPLNFIVDTGASSTVISQAALRRNRLENLIIPGEKVQVVGAAGVDHGVEAVKLGALTVDRLRKSHTRALVLNLEAINEDTGFEQDGILGGDFLRHFLVQLDLRKFELKLIRQSDSIELLKNDSR